MAMMKWIDLKDRMSVNARLKRGTMNDVVHLFIRGLPSTSPRWQQAIDKLGFRTTASKKYLVRALRPEDKRLTAASFHEVWPDAAYADMDSDEVNVVFNRPAATAKDQTDEEREIANELNNARLLGRNADGDQVYQSPGARFIYRGTGITRETKSLRPAMFLYAPDAESLDKCADGFVESMRMNEVQRTDDFERFLSAVEAAPGQALSTEFSVDARDRAHEAIDAAVVRFLTSEHSTPNDAFGDAERLYAYSPPYNGTARGKGAMPIPLSIIAQRLLGETAGKTVVIPNAFDGAAFSFLAPGTTIRAFKGKVDLSSRAQGLERDGLTWLNEFHHARESNAQAMFFNADPVVTAEGAREDYRDALLAVRSLAPDGRAVLVLAADRFDKPGTMSAQGRKFLDRLHLSYEIEEVFDTDRIMANRVGTDTALRVIALRNRTPVFGTQSVPETLPVCHSFDEVKTRVDEALARAAIKEQESEGIDLEKANDDNKLQRPYIAFSRVGEATTMVPKELQAPLQAFYSEFETLHGSVDGYVERELGYGENTLSTRFSPEQVDGIAMGIARLSRGRGHILGDETGIGKGRTLAALASWAMKNERPVVFVTNGAHLFSDLARDLRDIGEWGHVRPFVMNADGQIRDNIGEAGVLADGTKVGEMRRILDSNTSFQELGVNLIFTTYSQLSGADSEKAHWLKNHLKDALLIVDESHVAAGSDSNIATQIAEMTQLAWGVEFSSATWAKSSANLHIYARAFPESVNVATLAQTMLRGGEAFSEVFSSMLAREGALLRREHDLSKLEFVTEIDTPNLERNVRVADAVSGVMGLMAYASGDLKRLVTRLSGVNISALKEAREARQSGAKSSVFGTQFGTGSMLYNVHRRVNAALNADNAIRLAIEGIDAGRKPVIVFEDTGEAFIRQALQRQATPGPDGRDILPSVVRPPTIKDLLLKILDTLQYVKVTDVGIDDIEDFDRGDYDAESDEPTEDDDAAAANDARATDAPVAAAADTAAAGTAAPVEDIGVDATVGVPGDGGMPGPKQRKKQRPFTKVLFWELPDVAESDRVRFRQGMTEIKNLITEMEDIPLNAPDEIARRLGERGIRVGELSGRSFTLQPIVTAAGEPAQSRDAPGVGLCQVVKREKGKQAVNATVRAFNGGDLDVLMINRSAATGISLHASPRFADRRRRQLIEMQIPENPTDRIQLYGRVNRFDQESFPLIQVATTGNFGEVRQIMVQNKKLAEMSANVRSSRDSHAILREYPDLLNAIGRDVCRQYLDENPEVLSRLDIDPAALEDNSRDLAHLLTSRVPLLRSDEQGPVYEQLSALFDDQILEAELAGQNPLKPNELDVRAKVSPGTLMFGFDHQGLGSAFDGPVYAQKLEWVEDIKPLSLDAVVAAINVKREELLETGKAAKVGDRASGAPEIDLSVVATSAVKQLDAKVRLAMTGEMRQFRNKDEALAYARTPGNKLNPTLKSMVKMHERARWLEKHLHKLVPGRVIETSSGDGRNFRTRVAVITDIIPPPANKESQLVRWRVLTVAPGDQRPRSMTLNALIGQTTLTEMTERFEPDGTQRRPDQYTKYSEIMSNRLQIGPNFLDLVEATSDKARNKMRGSYFYEDFKLPFVGSRERSALVLTGNMYLASEWASQTKAGIGTIFTDDRGLRQRGILLQDKFKPKWLRYLPVRLWTAGMLHQFTDRLLAGDVPGSQTAFKVHTSFDAAWKATDQSASSNGIGTMQIMPGHGLVLNVGPKARRRINGMLRQAQIKIKDKVFPDQKVRPQDDPGHVIIRQSDTKATRADRRNAGEIGIAAPLKRSESHLVVLKAETPAKLHRAIEMMLQGPGLEIFVRNDLPIGQVARECMRDYFVDMLRADASDDPLRRQKLEEFLERERQSAAPEADTSEEDEILALFAEFGAAQRESEQPVRRTNQSGFDFEGGMIEQEDQADEPPDVDAIAPAADNDAADAGLTSLFGTARPRRNQAAGDDETAETDLDDEEGGPERQRMAA